MLEKLYASGSVKKNKAVEEFGEGFAEVAIEGEGGEFLGGWFPDGIVPAFHIIVDLDC